MLCQETSDTRQKYKEYKAAYFICQYLELDLKRVLAYPLTSVPLTFAHIDGLKISTDKSTLFSKLEMRLITAACIVDGMFLVHFHVDLSSTFGGQVNVALSHLVRRANRVDFACNTFKYPKINDITREDHGLV